MNTKIQVLNSVDLENISGGMYKPLESCGVSSSSCGDSSRNSENLKDFDDFLNGLVQPFGFGYRESKGFEFTGNSVVNFSGMFNDWNSTSARAGFLTAFAIFTGAIIGTYEGIKWAVKKIF